MNKPKTAELHVHLEGCVWKKHMTKWRAQAGNLFPQPDVDGKNQPFTFAKFLSIIRYGYNFLDSPEKYTSVLIDYLNYMEEQEIFYAEVQLNSALIRTFDINIKELLCKFNEEIKKRDKRIIKFIIDLPWQFSPASFNILLDDSEHFQELGVVGLSMGGDEALARPKEFAEVFKHAHKLGYKIMCHAGETTNQNFARNIIEELKPDRIGHGLSLSNWFIHRKERVIVDTCLTSNLALGLIDDLHKHPFGTWLNHDHIIATLSTDDPAIFNTTLCKEYELAQEYFDDFSRYMENKKSYLIAAAFDKEAITNALS